MWTGRSRQTGNPSAWDMMKPRKLDHVVSMLFGIERADHVGPFSRPRDRDRATAGAIRQALDGHDLDVLLTIFETLRQDLHQARAGARLRDPRSVSPSRRQVMQTNSFEAHGSGAASVSMNAVMCLPRSAGAGSGSRHSADQGNESTGCGHACPVERRERGAERLIVAA